jgi:hypothetical protein
MTLDELIHSLLTRPSTSPVKLQNGICLSSFHDNNAPCVIVEIKRKSGLPTVDEQQVAVNSIARALGRPGMEFLATEHGDNARRLYVADSDIALRVATDKVKG